MTTDNDSRWNYGAGSRPNIMVNVDVVEKSVECACLGILSIALSKGYANEATPLFSAYTAFMLDLIAIMSNQTTPVFGRLQYLNAVLASLVPKSVPFKTGTLTYSWKDTTTIQIGNAPDVRGYKYYLFVPGGSVNPAGWPIMDPPSAPSNQIDALEALAYLYNIIGNQNVPHLRYVPDISMSPQYKSDVSSFVAGSPYYGSGNSAAAGAASSIESEAIFQSNILAGYAQYSIADGRVGKKFSLATGDTTSGLACALLPGFFQELYNTVFPTSFAFLDVDEAVLFLQAWYNTIVSLCIDNTNPGSPFPSSILLALGPFSYSPQQFRIMVASCLRTMFSTSQSMGQFLTPSTDLRGFEPLRMGTNCFGKNRDTIITPSNFAENMRMLQPHIMDIPTQFYNKKNQWMLSPVWGIISAASANPINMFMLGVTNEGLPYSGPMFTGSSSNDPSVIDGTLNGQCLDLNCELIQNMITEWNMRITILKQYAGNTSFLEGSSEGCLLFQTRYAKYSQNTSVPVKDISPFMRHKIPKESIERVPRQVVRTTSQKSIATNKDTEYDEVYVPVSATLYTQQTIAFSSVPAFTTAQKTLINYLIYPVIIIEPDEPPTQQQIRVANLQAELLPIDQPTGGITSRGLDLIQYAQLCAPGLAAADTDELSSLFKHLSNTGKGGFLRDVCTALAGLIPW